ncbi:hypothetical protein [Nostoc sp.]
MLVLFGQHLPTKSAHRQQGTKIMLQQLEPLEQDRWGFEFSTLGNLTPLL